jgi:hypothetical protein
VESGQYENATGRVPDWWTKKPPEVRGDDLYLSAFWELSSCRNFGMGIGPIPWNFIVMYGERKGLDAGMLDVFVYVLRALDEVYLKDLHERQQQDSQQSEREMKRKAKT